MKLDINHHSLYKYDHAVQLNPHTLFLKPLQRDNLKLLSYNIEISPTPVGINERFSLEGNPHFLVWFSGFTEKLEITVKMELEVSAFNPFGFLMDVEFIKQINPKQIPAFRYLEDELALLTPYLTHEITEQLVAFAQKHLSDDNPLTFLMSLAADINENWEHIIRMEEDVWGASHTFNQKKGSCRDLSWMMIQLLRSVGLASRYVSGYAFNPELDEGNELHAWVEAYIPGAGWVGVDPNLGLLADEHYIPLACSNHPGRTLPVHGTVGGDEPSSSTLEASVTIAIV
jgi:transglutaminase-like putative cysteine protease